MNVVDSSGWLEYFGVGANADFFAPPSGILNTFWFPPFAFMKFSSGCWPNAAKKMPSKRHYVTGNHSRFNSGDRHAAQISTERKLAMADSVILATAYAHHATLWTQDGDFEGVEGVEYVQK